MQEHYMTRYTAFTNILAQSNYFPRKQQPELRPSYTK